MIKFYNIFKCKNYCFFVTNSLGELDFILPLILSIKKKLSDSKFSIFILSNKISLQFEENKMYKKLSLKLGVNVYSKSYKFNLNKKINSNTSHLIEILFIVFNLYSIIHHYLRNDLILIENSGRSLGSKFLRLIYFISKKKIILIPHTSSKINLKTKVKKFEKPIVFKKTPFMILNKSEIKYYKNFYFGEAVYFKNPINLEWKKFILKNFKKQKKENYMSIYLNNFIDKKTYLYLLLFTLKNIYKLNKNLKIYLKRHPRHFNFQIENSILRKVIKKFKKKLDIELSDENSSILSTFSVLNISLMSNSIFLCNEMNKNSVYFFLNSKEVRKRFKTLPFPLYQKNIKSFQGTKKINSFLKKVL